MKKGVIYAIVAYVIWGFFPFYWEKLGHIPALQVLSHRILWSFILLFALILITGQWKAFHQAAFKRHVLLIYLASAVLIAINWLTYVWAIGAGFIIESSLGYFINPLVSVLLGVVLLRERLRPFQWLPLLLVTGAVVYLTVVYGSLPWIALTLAFSFAFYGLVKKKAPLDSLQGLTLETGILFLPALLFLMILEWTGKGAFLHSSASISLMLVGAGLVTTTPLLLFSAAAPRVSLTTIGILMYINPALQFLLGLFVYHEPFSREQLLGFGIVWFALILFGIEGVLASRRKTLPAEAGYS
jgi:chloramphenicol-sensitive protein RarD